jgi:hypothetical protein
MTKCDWCSWSRRVSSDDQLSCRASMCKLTQSEIFKILELLGRANTQEDIE